MKTAALDRDERPQEDVGATMVEAIGAALAEALACDERVLLLGEDIGKNGGVFRATDGLYERFGARRVVDTPIAEAGTVGVAVGLCLAGYRPVVEVQFDTFTYPAFEQIAAHVARYRWRTGGGARMSMVLRVPFGGGVRAPELHSDSPEALFCHLPGLRVVCPSTPDDAFALLRWAIACNDPVVFMEPKRLYRGRRERLWTARPPEGAPGAQVLRQGADATLIGYGPSIPGCLAAAARLADEDGLEVEVLDLRSLWPLDAEGILGSVRRTGRCVVVHEAAQSCGIGAEVAALLAEHAFDALAAPVQRIAGIDAPFPLFSLEDEYLPSEQRIADAVRRTVPG